MILTDYQRFLQRKSQYYGPSGFEPLWIPDWLKDFQKVLTTKAVQMGRYGLFEDCGLGKTPQELVWAQNVVQHTNGRVLILAPLAVSAQHVREAVKFGIEVYRSNNGKFPASAKIIVTNYERLHYFIPDDFVGCVCDESSILKNFNGERKQEITIFMRKMIYRLLATATAAPNDFIELGTSSEALGYMGYMDMLGRFFKNNQNTCRPLKYKNKGKNFARMDADAKWRFKGHAEIAFWKWVCSWSRAVRKPSDLGFDNGDFLLPPLTERQHIVRTNKLAAGYLLALPAVGLKEQRDERRRSMTERCEKLAEIVTARKDQSLICCHLNPEGDLLEKIIPNCAQISGNDSDEIKEERLLAFIEGKVQRLVSKSKIIGFGINAQNCCHIATFPSHSYEQYYQWVRRCWRYGQKNPVDVDVITSEGELNVLKNMQRKSAQADKMFSKLIEYMNQAQGISTLETFSQKEKFPAWLQTMN
jgi:hypothetical protein